MEIKKTSIEQIQLWFAIELDKYDNRIASGICLFEEKECLFELKKITTKKRDNKKFYIYDVEKEFIDNQLESYKLFKKFVGNSLDITENKRINFLQMKFKKYEKANLYFKGRGFSLRKIQPSLKKKIAFFYSRRL
jgi:hypothetical protein